MVGKCGKVVWGNLGAQGKNHLGGPGQKSSWGGQGRNYLKGPGQKLSWGPSTIDSLRVPLREKVC